MTVLDPVWDLYTLADDTQCDLAVLGAYDPPRDFDECQHGNPVGSECCEDVFVVGLVAEADNLRDGSFE